MKARLRALEKNILKYRAFEMLLVLFHAERLKEFIIGMLRATDQIGQTNRLKIEAKKLYKNACSILVEDGVITHAESKEIAKLTNFRNDIGHRIQLLTCDLSRDRFARDFQKILKKSYDYSALSRLKFLRSKIEKNSASNYIMELSVDHVLFEDAEQVFAEELLTLRRKIDRQLKLRKLQIEELRERRRQGSGV